jgi:hypothetical protein
MARAHDAPSSAEESTMNQIETSRQTVAVAAVVTHEVSDYAAWKKAFDAHAPARKKGGIVASHINRSVENPNMISIYLAGTSANGLRDFLSSDDLKSTMQNAGVISAPQIALVKPVEDLTVKTSALAGAIVTHRVADYAAWKTAFDADASARAAAGIVGHAVNRAEGDASLVIVYLQAKSIDELRAFTSSPALKETMKRAGVTGAPTIVFAQGQEWGV